MSLAGELRRLRSELHQRAGLGARVRRRLDGTRALVLCYHRVIPVEIARRDAVEEGLFVTPEAFEAQLAWLEAEFHVLPLHELVSALANGTSLPRGACAITFDDGWRDNFDHALPGLRRRGLPATVFVVAERIGTAGAFWPDEVCRRLALVEPGRRSDLVRRLGAAPGRNAVHALVQHLKQLGEEAREESLEQLRAATANPPSPGRELMNWEELEGMAGGGVDVESHGATHAILTHLEIEARDRELSRARTILRDHGHGRHDLLAYPTGAFDPAVCRAARGAGYRAGFTIEAGLVSSGRDRMVLPRFCVHDGISGSRAELFYRLAGLE